MTRRTRLRISVVVTLLAAGLVVTASSVVAKSKAKPKPRRVTASEQLAFGVDMAKRGLWREALFRFQRAQLLEPGQPRVLNNLAVAYEAVGDFDSALEHYKLALAADPSNRDLKKNYARFVEFYQSFRPPEEREQPAKAADKEGAEAPASSDG